MGSRTTVVVVTWRGRDHLTECLDALAIQSRPHRTVVVDNASDDGTAELLAAHPSEPTVLRLPDNLGYAGGLAAAMPLVGTEFVAWLNDDAVPDPGWLAALEDALDADPRTAAASARLESPDGVVQSVGVGLTHTGHGADLTGSGPEVFGFCGGAALLRVTALAAAGGVPAEFFCYYEDTDTSWRLRLAGWSVASAPDALAVHRHGASTRPGSRQFHLWNERNRLLMLLRCAPAGVAIRELARFTAITVLLPFRPRPLRPAGGRAGGPPPTSPRPLRPAGGRAGDPPPTSRGVPDAWNFRAALRWRVLAEVAARLPATIRARREIGRRSTVSRRSSWRRSRRTPISRG